MLEHPYFVDDTLNGVKIQRPINHDLAAYLTPRGPGGYLQSSFDHPGHAIHSIEYKGLDEYEELPLFTVTFKVLFDSIQELADDFWRFESRAKLLEVLPDGVLIQADCTAACALDSAVSNPSTEYDYCWYMRDANLRGTDGVIDDDTLEEIEDYEHPCSGDIYSYAVSVVPVGAESVTHYGPSSVRAFISTYDQNILTMTDQEINDLYRDESDILTTVTSPSGVQYRVITDMHRD